MIKKSVLILLTCFLLSIPQAMTIFADPLELKSTKALSIEEAVQLSIANYADIQLANWKVVLSDAQLSYVDSEKRKLEGKDVAVTSGNLPTAPEYYLNSIPNYDRLSDEDKAAINQSIAIQIMINSSMNQLINAQTASQNSYNQQQKESQLQDFNDQLRSLETDRVLSRLELQKSQALIRYYTIQKYYQLSSLRATIEYGKKEQQYWSTQVKDALKLYSNGLISKKELEDSQVKERQQEAALELDTSSFQSQIDFFTQALGLSEYKEVILEEVPLLDIPEPGSWSMAFKLEDNFDLKEADAKIKLAKENLDIVKSSEPELKTYYTILWSSQIGNKNILQQQCEQKLAEYKAEANAFYAQYSQLKEQHEQLFQTVEDSNTLFSKGLISVAEKDKNELELITLAQKIDKQKSDYAIFLEKIKLANNGIIL
ncbi:TolC family protein [Paenibacillus sp. 19GGS1-52]|uniref:hypothetical protein n=1 Tax=Paenibacillus sp. 19GGS1-52 TaxID=2758563 RepID=UPI001EFAB52B|nr:hypothetical protein [Paenibacillus sp. 19GGS1-52]ULO08011.1 TolC family protein [Paenibacillus sp. 19GGS1-52]